MNRIDRLTAMLLFLQGGKRNAREISGRYEVSRRTVLRDIQALCEMGIPIAVELGVAGGYTLPPDYALPPLALTLHEALLLRLALGGLARLAETPYKKERETLLAKVQTLLPRRMRADLDRMQQTLSLDVPAQPYPTPFLDRLLECAREGQWVTVVYRSERGESRQTLRPAHLRATAGFWYCEAYSHERGEMRVYRVDRFLDVRATLPPQTDLPPLRLRYVDLSSPEVLVHLTARGVLRLEQEQHLASRVQHTAAGAGWLHVRLRPAGYDWLVRILLGLGTEARVLAPEELRLHLLHAARELAAHHAER